MSLFDQTKRKKASTQKFIGIDEIASSHLVTLQNKICYIVVTPYNLSVLSSLLIESMIKNFKNVMTGLGTAEYLCINSSQSYESNKENLANLAVQERNNTLKELDLQDIQHLDNIRIKMATNREFLIMLRFPNKTPDEQIIRQLHKAVQLLKENHFAIRSTNQKDLKRLLAIYFEQNIFEENFQNFDGDLYADTILEEDL